MRAESKAGVKNGKHSGKEFTAEQDYYGDVFCVVLFSCSNSTKIANYKAADLKPLSWAGSKIRCCYSGASGASLAEGFS